MLRWIRSLLGSSKETARSRTAEPDSAKAESLIPKQESHYVSAMEVKQKMDKGEPFILLDVREPHEVAHCSIPGARHIPMGEIHARYKELGDDTNAEIVVHCHHGGRSEVVMHQLWGLGYQNTKNMVGGIDAWSLDVNPNVPRY